MQSGGILNESIQPNPSQLIAFANASKSLNRYPSLAILIMMYFWAAVGGIIGFAVPIDTTTATIYAWMIGPSLISISVIAASLMYTGYAKKIGTKLGKLGIFNTTGKPNSD